MSYIQLKQVNKLHIHYVKHFTIGPNWSLMITLQYNYTHQSSTHLKFYMQT